MTYFGNSVTKIYTTQEDYKSVIICVQCCQIPIYTAVMLISFQLQIIITLLYAESMPVCSMITDDQEDVEIVSPSLALYRTSLAFNV